MFKNICFKKGGMYYVLIYGLCLNQSWDIHSIKYLAAVCMDLEPCLFILLDKKTSCQVRYMA